MSPSEYEQFVETLYFAVKTAENLAANLRSLKLAKNMRIRNAYGVKREFDIYWEYELDGDRHKTVIECKNYASRISIDKIDALVGKTNDFEGLTPIFATRAGYQSGAVAAAQFHEIELLIAREQNLSDWTDERGEPLIREVRIEINFVPPSRIHNFTPELDGSWIKENTDIDTSKTFHLSGMNNEMVIQDQDAGTEYSLRDLAALLRAPAGKENGTFTKRVVFKDAYFFHPDYGKLKLLAYRVEYSTYDTVRQNTEIDFGAALIGVIEYLNRGQKKLVFKDKVVTHGI